MKILIISDTHSNDMRTAEVMQEAWPFDQFPLTEHLETVCLLTHNVAPRESKEHRI